MSRFVFLSSLISFSWISSLLILPLLSSSSLLAVTGWVREGSGTSLYPPYAPPPLPLERLVASWPTVLCLALLVLPAACPRMTHWVEFVLIWLSISASFG